MPRKRPKLKINYSKTFLNNERRQSILLLVTYNDTVH